MMGLPISPFQLISNLNGLLVNCNVGINKRSDHEKGPFPIETNLAFPRVHSPVCVHMANIHG